MDEVAGWTIFGVCCLVTILCVTCIARYSFYKEYELITRQVESGANPILAKCSIDYYSKLCDQYVITTKIEVQ